MKDHIKACILLIKVIPLILLGSLLAWRSYDFDKETKELMEYKPYSYPNIPQYVHFFRIFDDTNDVKNTYILASSNGVDWDKVNCKTSGFSNRYIFSACLTNYTSAKLVTTWTNR